MLIQNLYLFLQTPNLNENYIVIKSFEEEKRTRKLSKEEMDERISNFLMDHLDNTRWNQNACF